VKADRRTPVTTVDVSSPVIHLGNGHDPAQPADAFAEAELDEPGARSPAQVGSSAGAAGSR